MVTEVIRLLETEFKTYQDKADSYVGLLNTLISINKVIDKQETNTSEAVDVDNFMLLFAYLYLKDSDVNLTPLIEENREYEKVFKEANADQLEYLLDILNTNNHHVLLRNDNFSSIYSLLNKLLGPEEIIPYVRIMLGNKLVFKKGMIKSVEDIDISDLDDEKKDCIVEFNEVLQAIEAIIKDILNELNRFKSKFNKIGAIYQNIQDKLLNNDKQPYLEIEAKGKVHLTEEIIYGLNTVIHQNHINSNDEIELAMMKLDNKSKQDQLTSVLRKFNLSLDLVMNKDFVIKYCDSSSVLSVLQNIKSIGLDFDMLIQKGLDYLLCCTTEEISSNILRYINNGLIDIDFIANNLGIFISKSKYQEYLESGYQIILPLYDTLEENVKTLKTEKVGVQDPSYSPSILLKDPTLVKETASLLKSYNINSLEFYHNPELFNLVDMLNEMGIDPEEINYTNVNGYNIELIIKRIWIANMIGMNIFYENRLTKEIVTGEGFYVLDDDLDSYIIDESNDFIPSDVLDVLNNANRLTLNEEPELLEDYLIDLPISNKKVLRNIYTLNNIDLNAKDKLFYAIIYRSYLSIDDINQIKDIVYNHQLLKKQQYNK